MGGTAVGYRHQYPGWLFEKIFVHWPFLQWFILCIGQNKFEALVLNYEDESKKKKSFPIFGRECLWFFRHHHARKGKLSLLFLFDEKPNLTSFMAANVLHRLNYSLFVFLFLFSFSLSNGSLSSVMKNFDVLRNIGFTKAEEANKLMVHWIPFCYLKMMRWGCVFANRFFIWTLWKK